MKGNDLHIPRQQVRIRFADSTISYWCSLLLILSLLPTAAVAQSANQTSPAEVRKLELGKPVERMMKGNESHTYEITLEKNQFLDVVVEQKGVDVVVQVIAPDGKLIMEADSPNGIEGPEPCSLVAEAPGRYQLKISSREKNAPQGLYEIRLLALRAATENDRLLQEAIKLQTEAGNLRRTGKYAEAMPLAERVISIRENLLGTENPLTAQAISFMASLYLFKGEYAKAEPLYLRALAINEKALGAEHPSTAQELFNLATLYRNKGDNEKAEPSYLRTLAICEKALGAEHPYTANTLNGLAALYRKKGDYPKAESLYTRARAITEKVYGAEHPSTAQALINLAFLYYDKGILEKVEPLYLRALAIREKVFGAEHAVTAQTLTYLANLYKAQRDFEKAEPYLVRALAIYEKTHGAEHPDTVATLNNLAGLYLEKQDYTKAEPLYLRVLAIREKTLGAEHPDTATTLNNLAILYYYNGDFEKAEPLYLRALAIREKVLGKEHPLTAYSLFLIATLYETKGDQEKAESLHLRALAIREKVLGAEHRDTLASLNNLAAVYEDKNDYEKAEPLLLRALPIAEKDKDQRMVYYLLSHLVYIYTTKGDYEKAEPVSIRDLAIAEKFFGDEHTNTASAFLSLANIYLAKGDYAKAEPLYLRALAISEKVVGSGHALTGWTLNSLARFYQITGNQPRAIAVQNRCNEVFERDFIRNLNAGSERQRLLYLKITANFLDITLSLHSQFAPDNLSARQMALRVLLQRKGRALDATANAIAALRHRASPEDQKLLDQLTTARSQLSNLTLKGASTDGNANYQSTLKALAEQVDKLEVELSRRSADFRAQAVPVTLEAVQAVVPSDAALIEFASFRPYNAKADKYGESRYVAYLFTNTGDIQWADLGKATTIDKAVKELRTVLHQKADGKLSDISNEVMPKARALDDLIMRPLRPLLGDKTRLLISPDGALNLIPFDALVDEKNHYLVESYSISYLTSGRDLLRLQAAKPNNKTALVFADPDFDIGAASLRTTTADSRSTPKVEPVQKDKERIAQRVDTNKGPKLGSVQLQALERLPGSAKEGRSLKKLLPEATVLTREQATETALKRVSSPSILHISTHGGFLEDEPQPEANAQRGLLIRPGGASGFNETLPPNAKAEDASLRSGLFFAGANTGRSGDDDGVLTALEAAGLDLYGTKLVVLSACDTGVGEVKNGDGVYGLRRAFVLAGAETQVMSLWSVSDEGTRELMVEYYKRLLAGEGRGEALRQVRLKMLASKHHKHPFYWASFIQSGEWANLDGKR